LQTASTTGNAQILIDAIAIESGLVLVLTGAGISLASGIPTFRGNDPGAVWTRDVTELGTYRYFKGDPIGSWKWYRRRFALAGGAKPNAAHIALAILEQWKARRGGKFLCVTQNIDTLHEQAGSVQLIKVHGSADRVRCSNPSCRCSLTETIGIADLDFDAFDKDPRLENIPRCSECDALIRPHVLWFDEFYTGHVDFQWSRVIEAASTMRLLLAVGTSFSVGVTQLLLEAAYSRRVPIIIVDPNADNESTGPRITNIFEKAELLLPVVCSSLMEDHAGSV
jgi:NAD-dependent deacetylase